MRYLRMFAVLGVVKLVAGVAAADDTPREVAKYFAARGCSVKPNARGEPEEVRIAAAKMERDLSKLATLPSLHTVWFNWSGLSEQELRDFPKLPGVATLIMNPCDPVDDAFAERIPELFPNLDTLVLDATYMTDKGVAVVGKLKKLHTLRIANLKKPPTAVSFGAIAKLSKLTTFTYDAEGRFDEEAAKALAASKTIDDLSFDKFYLKDAHLRALCTMKQLKKLSINRGGVTDEGFASLPKLENVTDLKVDSKAGADAIGHLAKMKSLRNLSIRLEVKSDRQKYLLSLPLLKGVEYLDSFYGIADDEVPFYLAMPSIKALGFGYAKLTGKGITAIFESGKITSLSLISDEIPPDHYAGIVRQYPGLLIRPGHKFDDWKGMK